MHRGSGTVYFTLKLPVVQTAVELTLCTVTEQRQAGNWTFIVHKYDKSTSTGQSQKTEVKKGAEAVFGNTGLDVFTSGGQFPGTRPTSRRYTA
jgi:hypothetical protein